MYNKTLTVSVAAYNVEKYLDKLFSSLLDDRVLDDIEILVLNDGSKDGTAAKTAEYEKKYPNTVKLVDKQNGGHGSTINKGIELAKGKYFRALDGDDWVETEGFVDLISRLKNEDADIVLCNFKECYESSNTEKLMIPAKLADGAKDTFENICNSFRHLLYHETIFKTEILQKNNIRLDEHCFYVDTEFMLYPVFYANTVTYYDICVYCYRLGAAGQSVSPESRCRNISNSLKVSDSILSFYVKNRDGISDAKRRYAIDVTAIHSTWTALTYLLFPKDVNKKAELIEYENKIKNTDKDVYYYMEKKSKGVWLLRKSNYALYGFLKNFGKFIH